MLEEEVELERQMYGPKDAHSDEESVKTVTPNVDTFEPENDDDLQDEPVITDLDKTIQEIKDTEAEKKKSSWKQRFVGYKASTDKTISNLRKENLELGNTIAKLSAESNKFRSDFENLKQTRKDIYEDIISQQDIDTLGPEAVDIIKKTNRKAAEAVIAPLQEEINRLKVKEVQDLKKAAEERRRVEYASFTQDLSDIVPDYKKLNVDPGFEKFMMETDQSTGEKRLDLFRRAEDYLDSSRVADFFKDYKASIPKSKREVLEDKMTPTSSSNSSETISAKKDTFTMAEVNKFFDDITKGLYKNKPKEAIDIEARITKAYIAGTIKG